MVPIVHAPSKRCKNYQWQLYGCCQSSPCTLLTLFSCGFSFTSFFLFGGGFSSFLGTGFFSCEAICRLQGVSCNAESVLLGLQHFTCKTPVCGWLGCCCCCRRRCCQTSLCCVVSIIPVAQLSMRTLKEAQQDSAHTFSTLTNVWRFFVMSSRLRRACLSTFGLLGLSSLTGFSSFAGLSSLAGLSS